jgi:hypothetical protein
VLVVSTVEGGGFTRAQRGWARFALVVSFLLVGGVAAVMSYTHIKDVSLIAHQGPLISHLMPLAVDGMMLIATVAILEDKAYGRYPRGWARFGFWVGAVGSTAANIASVVVVWGWDWLAVAFAGAPPLLLMLSVEIVSKPGRLRAVVDTVRRVSHSQAVTEPATAQAKPSQAPQTPQASEATQAPEQTSPTPGVGTLAAAVPPAGNGETNRGGAADGERVRRGRPEDNEPLDQRLVELALTVGRAWRERTGREITRDGLRSGLRDAGWQRGISNVTAGRLLDLIRNDTDGQTNTNDDQQAERAAVVAANGR